MQIQFADYAIWQRKWMVGDELGKHLAFWTDHLRGAPEEIELPLSGPRPPLQTSRGHEHAFVLDPSRTASVRALAQRHGATLFMTLAAAFRTLLVRYTGESDVLIGTAVDNRAAAAADELVGMFTDTLVLRTPVALEDSFATLLAREKAGTLAAFSHQHAPFERIVEALGIKRSLSRPPLVQVLYVHQGFDSTADRGATVETGQPPTAEFDISLVSKDDDATLTFYFLYNADLFEPALIEQLGAHLQRLLECVAIDPGQRLLAIDLLDDSEHALLRTWSTNVRDAKAPLIGELIAQHVARRSRRTRGHSR